jgi:multidrug efflux pump
MAAQSDSRMSQPVQGPENSELAAWANRTPAIILNIQRQPGTNVIAVVDAVKALLPKLEATLPAGVDVAVLSDQTATVRASVADIEFELALAVALVVLVIFIFLRNLPATLIPSLSVPLSLVGTLAGMYLFGFSLDNLSLMSLTIASGFVVDDAIVMIENISRYIERGDPPLQATLTGAGEIGFTIISLTVSLIAVLIPLLFMQDVVGRLFHEFAITLAITIILSAVVSLTLVPMMCALIMRHHPETARSRISLITERGFQSIINGYDTTLQWVLNRQVLTLVVAIGALVLTSVQYIQIPKGFFPIQDTGAIQGITSAAQDVSFSEMARRQQALAEVILRDKDVTSLSSFIGIDGVNTALNTGRMLIALKPRDERSETAVEIIRRLNRETKSTAGISIAMQPVQDLTIDSTVGKAQYLFFLENPNQSTFKTWVPKLVDRMSSMPEFENVSSDLELNGKQLKMTIDRGTAARFGITPATIDNALYDAFGQRIASTYFTQTNQYRVILSADVSNLVDVRHTLDGIYLPSATATTGQVPLSAVVSLSEDAAPLKLEHLGQFPSVSISFDLAPGASLGDAVDDIKKAEDDIGLPETFTTAYQGALCAFQRSLSNELYLIVAAVAAVYIMLGVLYESFAHPITIISTLPSAGVGALLALNIAGAGLEIIGIIGIVLLIGIVKKNAIMMIDFALEAQRVDGKSPREAIHSSLSPSFPAYPDDDDVGAVRRIATCVRTGNWIGTAAAARDLHRRRPAVQPISDALHDSRRLPRDRPAERKPFRSRRDRRAWRCARRMMAKRGSP